MKDGFWNIVTLNVSIFGSWISHISKKSLCLPANESLWDYATYSYSITIAFLCSTLISQWIKVELSKEERPLLINGIKGL